MNDLLELSTGLGGTDCPGEGLARISEILATPAGAMALFYPSFFFSSLPRSNS
jgi:hypothetical protein